MLLFIHSMLYVWPRLEKILDYHKQYPDLKMISKQYHKQDNTNTNQLFEPALRLVNQPYSRKTLFNVEEKYKFYSGYKCSVVVAWSRAFPILLTIPFRPNWEYSDLINFAMLRRINHGFVKLFQKRYYGGNFVTCPSNFKGTALGLYKVLGTFVILTLGICASLIIFAFEFIHHWLVHKSIFMYTCQMLAINFETQNCNFDETFRKMCANFGPLRHRKRKLFDIELRKLVKELNVAH